VKHTSPTINLLQYLALRVYEMFLHMFPIDVNLGLARVIGNLWYLAMPKHRKRAGENLRRSFSPEEMSDEEIARVARASCEHFVCLLIEIMFTPRLIRPESWYRYLRLKNLSEPIRMLLDQKPVILITGHYGNWELLGFALAALGFPTNAVARAIENPYINRHLLGIREGSGLRVLDKWGVGKELRSIFDQGESLAFIADQNAGRKGVFVDFFGRKASTYRSVALIAHRWSLPIVVGYARRIGKRFFYEVGCQEIIRPEDWKGRDDEIVYITQRFTKAIEDFIRVKPEQYLWIHRRWKTRPPEERAA